MRTHRTPTTIDRLALVAAVFVSTSLSAFAADKNGASPQAISRPSGPGSLEGLGDAFQPALNTGTARYSYRFALPPGIAGHTPTLALSYDSGRGCGVAGMGWTLDTPSIRRQTDEGQPRYFDLPTPGERADRFLGANGEELVPLANGYFLCRTEGSFARYRRDGDHWEAHSKSGIKMEYGLTDAGRVSDLNGDRLYRWWIERQTDRHGNVIEYSYIRPDIGARQVYLSEIRYGPGAPPWTHSYVVKLFYEQRPDQWNDYRAGYRIGMTHRLDRVDVLYNSALIRRYELGYGADPDASLLTTVTQFGTNGVAALPTTTFGYATFQLPDPAIPISAAKGVIGSVGEPGAVLDSPRVELIDLNLDGLPDLLNTDAAHLAYLNGGTHPVGDGQVVSWQGPVAVNSEDGLAIEYGLPDIAVHLADMNGDGTADWIVTASDGVDCFANTGRIGWARRRRVTVDKHPPPAPYAAADGSVLSTDLDFDKRMDIIKSEDGAYSIWLNKDNGTFSDRILTPGANFKGKFLAFSHAGTQLADMNGDRLADVVEVNATSVVFCPSMGFGQYDECVEMPFPPQDPALESDQIQRAKVIDINGDGLADLVVERFSGPDLRFWLHMPNDTLARSRYINGLPATPNSATRWADINGNGTVDLIYADSSLPSSRINTVDIGLLVAGSSHYNALTSIDNGYGRRTEIRYRGITEYYLEAGAAGNPWTTTVPFPLPVVSRTLTKIGLDLDGYADEGPGGDHYITDFVYRDGYYDPLKEQFRGFAFVKQIARGDERFGGAAAPTLVTRFAFHTGAPDGVDNDNNNEIDEFEDWNGREEEPLKGAELWKETTSLPDDPAGDGDFAANNVVFERTESSYEILRLCTAEGGAIPDLLGQGYEAADTFERNVRLLVPTKVRRTIIEKGNGSPRLLETQSYLDPFGNTKYEWNRGDLSNPRDDLHLSHDYIYQEPAWILDRPSRTLKRDGDADGAIVSDLRNYYDGPPFQGLPLGQIASRGVLHRTEHRLSFASVPLTERSFLISDPRNPSGSVNPLRQKFDAFGNVIVKLDANAALGPNGDPDGNGHERRIDFDPALRKFPIRETIVVGDGSPELVYEAGYDLRFGTVTSLTDFNGHQSAYIYDEFGRLKEDYQPGDAPNQPTDRYTYDLAAPISRITTHRHAGEGDSPDVETVQFFDGMGRKLGVFDAGGPVMTGVTLYNTRGTARKVFQPYEGGGVNWNPPPATVPAHEHHYDATGRQTRTIAPPDANGAFSEMRTVYAPLKVVEYDGEDSRLGGLHENTPKTIIYDGLERLVEVRQIENLSPGDPGEIVTKYRYAQPSLLAEIEDAKGNIKYLRYDGLGRKIFMNDCDRGHMTYSYDAVGNLTETIDANGQHVAYAFDGANRMLSEDYLDAGHPLSLNRTPDVAFHYDLPADEYPALRNTMGRVAWVTDLTGAEFRGYDARGEIDTVIKRIDQPNGKPRDYTTISLSDSLKRVYQITYPDGGVVKNQYDARGLLREVGGFVDNIDYTDSSMRQRITYANGVATTFAYDPRLRATSMNSNGPGGLLQRFAYTYDQVGNLVTINDQRALAPADPRDQTASFQVDDSYRLAGATGAAYGSLAFDYDRIGNMLLKTNPGDAADHVGSMTTGGAAGTAGRVGRAPGDAPGPHALTSTDVDNFLYDANGNLTQRDDAQYLYDFRDRLGGVVKGDDDIRYLYDFTGRRVIKRVNGKQTSYVSRLTEARGDSLTNYVFAGTSRIASVEGAITPTGVVTQRVPLVVGWNLISFQLTPASNAPSALFAGLGNKLTAAFGYEAGAYKKYIPNGVGNTLLTVAPNRGYWLLMSAPADLIVEGTLSLADVQVPAGHALVGFPGLAARPSAGAVSNPAASLWTYAGDAVSWLRFQSSSPSLAKTLSGIAPGTGYWFISANATTLSAPTNVAGERLFFHADHLGSTHLMTDESGAVAQEAAYYPFGSQRYSSNAQTDSNDYLFGGKERDRETGLQCFETRFYDPHLARFMTVDPLFGDSPRPADEAEQESNYMQEPLNFNLYAFTNDNPVSRIDPTGTETVFLINKARTEITVRTNIVIYGPMANKAMATEIQKLISDKWNKGFQYDGKTVKFDVRVKYENRAAGFARHIVNPGSPDLVYIGKDGRSNVDSSPIRHPVPLIVTGDKSTDAEFYTSWKGGGSADRELQRVAAHEYGHMIGLPDLYRDQTQPDGTIKSVPNPGWEGNIMADATGEADARNIEAMMLLRGNKELKQE